MTLNITERDKKLLIILAFAVIGFLLYLLVYTPQIQTLTERSGQLGQMQADYDAKVVSDQYVQQTQTQIDKAEEAIGQKADAFMPTYSADKYLYLFSTLAQNSGLQVNSITTPGPQVVDVSKLTSSSSAATSGGVSYTLRSIVDRLQILSDEDSAASSSASSSTAASTTPANMEMTTLSLTLTGSSYANILAFMKSIEAQDKSIRFTSVEISKSGAAVSASMQIDIYSIDKIPGQDTDYQFNALSPNGTQDPFR